MSSAAPHFIATLRVRRRLDNRPRISNFSSNMPSTFRSVPFQTNPVIRASKSRRAFTLLEILVVLAIIGLLAGLAISNVDKIFGGAQTTTASLFVRESMKTSLTTYRIHVGDYPSPGAKNKGSYDLYSKGPDKVDGNEDDIGNWDAPAAPTK
jgi:general secretion pathway protein G